MKDFLLNLNEGFNIEIFSESHFVLILITLISIIFIIKNKNRLINLSDCSKKNIRLFLAIILIINLIIRRGSFIFYGVYDWHTHLDINFCNFTSLMFLIYALTGNNKIYPICFYMSFIGPFMAILFPSVNISPLNYSFYSYIIIHHIIFIYNFIFLFMENITYKKKNFYYVILFIFIYFFIVEIFNIFLRTTYNHLDDLINVNLSTNIFLNYICNNYLLSNVIFYLFIIILLCLGNRLLYFLTIKK